MLLVEVPIAGLGQAKKRPESDESYYCDPMVEDCPPPPPPAAGMYGNMLWQQRRLGQVRLVPRYWMGQAPPAAPPAAGAPPGG